MTVIGFFAGIMASTVGGAALINAPFLLLLGISPSVAIATGKFSLISGSLIGGIKYYKTGIIHERKMFLMLIILGVIGSLIGAQLVLKINQDLLKLLIVAISIVVLFVIYFKKDIGSETRKINLHTKNYIINTIVIFLLSIYSGFFGAGVGVFMLFTFAYLFGYTYLKSTAFMTVINAFAIGATSIIFAYHGLIDFKIGIPLLIGNAIGGFTGSHVAVLKGNKLIRPLFLVVTSILIIRLVLDIIGGKQ